MLNSLYLDVWAPANATKNSNYLIKVWIDGGISNPAYNGCTVARNGAVLVSINYGLGSLGFFALCNTELQGNQGT